MNSRNIHLIYDITDYTEIKAWYHNGTATSPSLDPSIKMELLIQIYHHHYQNCLTENCIKGIETVTKHPISICIYTVYVKKAKKFKWLWFESEIQSTVVIGWHSSLYQSRNPITLSCTFNSSSHSRCIKYSILMIIFASISCAHFCQIALGWMPIILSPHWFS